MADLRYEFEKWKVVRADMLQGFAELWDDEEALQDTVEGETGLTVESLAEKAAEEILQAKALAAAAKARAAEMKARASRLEASVESLRGLLIQLMSTTDTKKIVCPVATISLRPTKPALLVLDEPSIPTKYWKESDPVLDKVQLAGALNDGAEIEGAIMSEPGTTVAIKAS